jgi:hypothetical protein
VILHGHDADALVAYDEGDAEPDGAGEPLWTYSPAALRRAISSRLARQARPLRSTYSVMPGWPRRGAGGGSTSST